MSMPEKIGRYEIIEELGQGGMAVVYLARDPLMERQVAIKLLPRQLTFDQSLRGRFQKEARIVASLEHPAIVPVHDFGEYNEQPFLVMRYMVGGSLRDHTHDEPQSLPEIVRILSPLSQALDKAHTRHIIHRDLKPDNILFDGDDNPYLSDFGIARLTEGTQTTSIMGTPAYMSPEQIKGDVELDGRSDIYALGVILFEMLSGKQPYTADTPTQVMMKHVLEPIPIIIDKAYDLPPMTQLVIERAMAKERDDRYATAEELLEGVKELLTASQSAEVGAVMAGTMLQGTMLEIPEPEPDPLATVVEPIPTPSSLEIEREAQAAALYARLQSAVGAKDWAGVLVIGANLQEVDPNYRDVQVIMEEAKMQQAGLPSSAHPPAEKVAPEEPTGAEPDSVKKDSPSRIRRILLIGCVMIILIFLCLVTVGVFGYFASLEDTADSGTRSEGSQTAGTAEFSLPGILFSDSFEEEWAVDNWDLWQDETAEFGIGNGRLLAMGFDADTMNWVKQNDTYTDLELSVTADILVGGNSAFFGVVFDGRGDDYVGCFVQGDESAYCVESLAGETEYGDWVIVDLYPIKDNEILFVVKDEEWAMVVNDRCVGSGFVDFGSEGQLALAVSTASSEDIASIAYDDFQVRTPTAEGQAFIQCEPDYYE